MRTRPLGIVLSVVALMLVGCGGGSSSGGGGEAATAGFTDDMRGTWTGTTGRTTRTTMNITVPAGGDNAGSANYDTGGQGPISITKEGNQVVIVVAFTTSNCTGRHTGRFVDANTMEGSYSQSGDCTVFRDLPWQLSR